MYFGNGFMPIFDFSADFTCAAHRDELTHTAL